MQIGAHKTMENYICININMYTSQSWHTHKQIRTYGYNSRPTQCGDGVGDNNGDDARRGRRRIVLLSAFYTRLCVRLYNVQCVSQYIQQTHKPSLSTWQTHTHKQNIEKFRTFGAFIILARCSSIYVHICTWNYSVHRHHPRAPAASYARAWCT